MNIEDLKDWIYENRRGLIVGTLAGFVLSRIIR